VAHALATGAPVVALESTIITHGMPYPQNLETAMQVEAIVRQAGATPATVAIVEGVPRVGISQQELEFMARTGRAAVKTSRRDISYVMSRGLNGATTVSATMVLAARAGLKVFVTGGIGGVHRGGEETLDISADLTELGRTSMCVVCAGVKSILDIPRTLEYLETQGVTVAAFGTDEFPAFFKAQSGCKSPMRVDSPEEVADMILSAEALQLENGIVLGVPTPQEYSDEGDRIEDHIQESLREAGGKGISGNAITPYLLQRVNERSGGASLAVNIALIKNNAAVGSSIAVALAKKLRST